MKLIRSKIAEEVETRVNGVVMKLTDEWQIKHALASKLMEECCEVVVEIKEGNRNELIEELGDVLEVILSIQKYFNIGNNKLQDVMKAKRDKKGDFKGLYFCINKGDKNS